MNRAIGLIIIFAVGAGFLLFFIIKSIVSPKQVGALAALIKNGRTGAAIKAAKRLIAKDPKNAEAHYYLGLAYQKEKRGELALMEFKTVNQLGISEREIPEVEFRQTLAQLFIQFNQGEEALKEYLLLIKLLPTHSDYYYWAGKLFTERNRMDMAEQYLRKAAELSPRDGKIHYELGVMLYKDKKASEAKAALNVALKHQRENTGQTYFYLGKIQKDSKDYTGAAASFEKAARDAKFRIRALVERGGCFMSLNAVEKAIPDLERAVGAITAEADSDSLYARYFLGMCYEKNRDLDKAIAQWDKIYAQKKNFRDVGEKLSQYQDLRSDDGMKDYITAAPDEFTELCKAVTAQSLELQVQTVKSFPEGCELVAIEGESAKWRNTRKMPRLIRFFQSSDPLDEPEIRSILDDAKEGNITRAVVLTGSDFTRAAIEYASSRPVELFNRDKLSALLKGVKVSSSKPRTTRRS
ncbi:MAG: tetratricopeptide repeat protein [Treponema sp.]|jgi:tetratricopeptide (TPR) repeat protein|nr:tetratricopeptide repeat protein [Treponema sp.]